MRVRLFLCSQTVLAFLVAMAGVWSIATGCGPEEKSVPLFGSASTRANAGGGNSTAGGGAAVPCTPEVKSEITHSVGNYDNLSCNKAQCHATDKVGGWMYASPMGYPWVAGATITITNTDGSKLTAVSASDGFFDFGAAPTISSRYEVCASKCPSTNCNVTSHTSTDCLSSGCHASPLQRIYVTTPNTGTGGTGSTGQNCVPPASGGPYVHLETIYSATNNQPCASPSCHGNPAYKGGFLYDGPTSSKTVAEATITLRSASGSPLNVVTGPDGMFFFGSNGTVTTTKPIPVPYTACVSKCPTATLCSAENLHTTADDCGICHNGSVTDKVYLR